MVDEVFSHRLGMIPLNVDPALLEMKESPQDQATDRNTIVFKLQIECTRNTAAPRDSTDSAILYHNTEVLARHLEWVPQGEQAEVFATRPPAPTIPETVLMKLRPGQAMEMEVHAVKGVGKDHAKFSPVGAYSFFLLSSPSLSRCAVQRLRVTGYYHISFWMTQILYHPISQHASGIASLLGRSKWIPAPRKSRLINVVYVAKP